MGKRQEMVEKGFRALTALQYRQFRFSELREGSQDRYGTISGVTCRDYLGGLPQVVVVVLAPTWPKQNFSSSLKMKITHFPLKSIICRICTHNPFYVLRTVGVPKQLRYAPNGDL